LRRQRPRHPHPKPTARRPRPRRTRRIRPPRERRRARRRRTHRRSLRRVPALRLARHRDAAARRVRRVPRRRRSRRHRMRPRNDPRAPHRPRPPGANDRFPRRPHERPCAIGRGMSESRKLSIGFVLAAVLLLWLGLGIAATSFWPVFQSAQYIAAVGVAVLAGTAIAVLGARGHWSSLTVFIVTVATFALLGVQLAVPSKAIGGVLPSLAGLGDLFAGVALGWKQLLTITLPVGDYQALLVPPFAFALAVTVASVTIALRSRVTEVAAIGPLLLYIVGLAFGPDFAIMPVPTTIALGGS